MLLQTVQHKLHALAGGRRGRGRGGRRQHLCPRDGAWYDSRRCRRWCRRQLRGDWRQGGDRRIGGWPSRIERAVEEGSQIGVGHPHGAHHSGLPPSTAHSLAPNLHKPARSASAGGGISRTVEMQAW